MPSHAGLAEGLEWSPHEVRLQRVKLVFRNTLSDQRRRKFVLFFRRRGAVSSHRLFAPPPIRKLAFEKTQRPLSIEQRGFSIAVLLVVSVIAINMAADTEKVAKEAQATQQQEIADAAERRRLEEELTANRASILGNAKSAFDKGQFESALQSTASYAKLHDAEINALRTKAAEAIARAKNAERVEVLEASLKTVSPADTQRFLTIYQELYKINPDNKIYKERSEFYSERLQKEKQKNLDKEARKKQLEKVFSPWDGSVPQLVELVKGSMNDPDSYKLDETRYIDKGDYLIVYMGYRGTNKFGGVVRAMVKAKVDLNGQVLEILASE
jgi:hypothetical protein